MPVFFLFLALMQKRLPLEEYKEGILKADRVILSKAITLTESALPADEDIAQQLINELLPYTGKSVRVGITGVPGVGKSTFIESFGNYVIEKGKKLAILAIDPTSGISKGSIMGDKTRMETLSMNPKAYIRPTPSGLELGGVARKTRETMLLCEAAGFDLILIETVGVGQSETSVYNMVDFFLLLMLAGAGDELQGIKRGIMEMADALVITKADGDNIDKAKLAQAEYRNAMHLFPLKNSGWTPEVLTCSALQNAGINTVWQVIEDYVKKVNETGYFQQNRKSQNVKWMHDTLRNLLENSLYQNQSIKEKLTAAEQKVLNNQLGATGAAKQLLESYFKSLKS